MNAAKIIEYSKTNLRDSSVVIKDTLLKGTFSIEKKDSAIFFVEYSDRELTIDLLHEYHDKFISQSYFALSGDMQWNLYFLFVRDMFDENVKYAIEGDQAFARKYVLTEEEYLHYFDIKKIKAQLKQDISITWKKEIEEKNYDFVLDPVVTYVEGVKSFLEDGSKDAKVSKKKKNTITTDSSLRLDRVDELLEYNKKRVRSKIPKFAQVNLITGANASGKTSTLEFIEMAICGASLRNGKSTDPSMLKVSFNNGTHIEEYSTKGADKYIARDKAWYHSNLGRVDGLVSNFSKYNFFDSDASFRLNQDDTAENVTKALTQIALGKDVNLFHERIKGFQERFENEANKTQKKIASLNVNLADIKKQEDLIKKNSYSPEEKLKRVIDALEKDNWKASKAYMKSPELLEQDILKQREIIDSLVSLLENESFTLKKVKDEKKSLIETLVDIKKISKLLNQNDAQKEIVEDQLSQLRNQSKDFESLSNFLKNSDWSKLKKYITRVRELSPYVTRVESSETDYLLGVIFSKEIDTHLPSGKVLTEVENKIKNAKDTIQRLTKKQKEIEGSSEKINVILEEIKELGRQYISLAGDEKCPMCLTNFEKGKLTLKIKSKYQLHTDETHLNFKKQVTDLNFSLKEFNEDLSSINILFDIYKTVSLEKLTKIKEMSIEEINKYLDKIFKQLREDKKELESLNKEIQLLQKLGVDSSKLSSFEKIFSKYLGEEFSDKSSGKFTKLYTQYQKDFKNNENKLKELSLENKEKTLLLKQLLQPYSVSIQDNYIDELESLSDSLDNSMKFFNLYSKIREIGEEDSLKDLAFKANIITKSFDIYKAEVKNKKELESKITQNNLFLDKYTKELQDITLLNRKATEISEFLTQLLLKHSPEKELEEFYKGNINTIKDIYLKIHSPKEFSAVIFDKNQLFLERKDQMGRCSVTQISSGQRAALALSIFLALNRNLNDGPNIIIFDDPVIFADDLNALSFFDFLRVLAVVEKKQIFFATANAKIQNLFKRKFGFLGEEFQHIELSREVEIRAEDLL